MVLIGKVYLDKRQEKKKIGPVPFYYAGLKDRSKYKPHTGKKQLLKAASRVADI